jgi:hypothetical protein
MKKADNFDASKWLVENKITTQSRLNENESVDILISSGFKEGPDSGNYYYKFSIPFSDSSLDYVSYQPKSNLNKYYIIDKYGQELKTFNTLDEMISHLKTYMKMHQSSLNENEDTDILSFLKSNKQELLSKLTKKFEWDEDDMEMMSEYEIEIGGDADGNEDAEIAGLGEAGLDFSFNPKKVKDTYGDASNFKLVIAGKPIYGISYNM